jgi:hypothetical protein
LEGEKTVGTFDGHCRKKGEKGGVGECLSGDVEEEETGEYNIVLARRRRSGRYSKKGG